MKTTYSRLVVLDCKSTVWEKPADQPPGQSNEIIEVDVAVIDTAKHSIIEDEVIFVKPKRSKVSKFCEAVFNVSQGTLDKEGIAFKEAARRLRVHYFSKKSMWCSWSEYERNVLDKQCRSDKVEDLLSHQHLNLGYLFCLMTGLEEAPSLDQALEYCNLSPNANDAINTANLFLRMAGGLLNKPLTIKSRAA